jgi:beta-galactosidase
MGNSTGNMKEFWDLFRSKPRLIGGCIWDFKDQGLLKTDSLGIEFYAYGGDFGEERHHGNFCINGIVAADGRPKSGIYECKRIYQPVVITLIDDQRKLIRIENRHASISLEKYSLELQVLQNGNLILKENLPGLKLSAGKDTVLDISSYLPKFKKGQEYLASLHFNLSEDKAWAQKGFEVASNQFALTSLPVSEKETDYSGIKLIKTDTLWTLEGKGFAVGYSPLNGALTSYQSGNKQHIKQDLLPHFSRPQTDNDRKGWKTHKILKEWYDPDLTLKDFNSVMNQEDGTLSLIANYTLIQEKAEVKIVYKVDRKGVIKVDYSLSINEKLPNIPKVGMQCGIDRSYEKISWYGRGPFENYVDKRYGSDVGIYSLPIDEFMESYVYPQENGNRTDVRWLFLSSQENKGLLVVADSLLSMSAWPYTEGNINSAKHTNELKDAGFITLNIDLIQMGVGGNDGWSEVAAPLDKYQIPAKDYSYSFYLVPLTIEPEKISEKFQEY